MFRCALLALVVALLIPPSAPAEEVAVTISKSIDRVKGAANWPSMDGMPSYMMAILEERRVVITLPGQKYSLDSKYVFLSQSQGVVRQVDVSPVLKRYEYEECLVFIESMVKELSLTDEEGVIKAWRTDGRGARAMRFSIGDKAEVRVVIRPSRDSPHCSLLLEFTDPSLFR